MSPGFAREESGVPCFVLSLIVCQHIFFVHWLDCLRTHAFFLLFFIGGTVRGAGVFVLLGADRHAGHHSPAFLASQLYVASGDV